MKDFKAFINIVPGTFCYLCALQQFNLYIKNIIFILKNKKHRVPLDIGPAY